MGTLLDVDITAGLAAAVLALSVCILTLKPHLPLARASACIVTIGVIAGGISSPPGPENNLALALYMGTLGLLPWALVYLYRASIDATSSRESVGGGLPGLLRFLGWAGLVSSLLATALWATQPLALLARVVLLASILGAAAALFWMLARLLRATAIPQSHSRITALLVAAALAIAPLVLLRLAPSLLGLRAIIPSLIAMGLLWCLPLAVVYVSLPLRAGSLTSLVDRLSVYALLTLALVLSYVLVAYGLERAMAYRADTLVQLTVICFAALASVTYAPLRGRLQRVVDNILYRDHYDYGETLRRFSQQLATLRSRDDLLKTLLDDLALTLNLSYAAAVGLPEGIDTRALALVEEADLMVRGSAADSADRRRLVSALAALDLTRLELSSARPVAREPWPGCTALVLIGAETAGHGGALLILGPKQTGVALRAVDGALLETLSHQAATALSNATLLEGLRTSLAQVQISTAQLVAARAEQQLLLTQIVDSEERQRAALSHDLHDDALQEVLYLVRHSHLAADMAGALVAQRDLAARASAVAVAGGPRRADRDTPQISRLQQELRYLAERATIAEQRLRSLCMGLYPALLTSIGLVGALQELARELSASGDIDITIADQPGVTAIAAHLDSEVVLHIYRVVQEALRNAAKHANASTALVTLSVRPVGANRGSLGAKDAQYHTSHLQVDIEDNGAGIPSPLDYGAILREGHMGLAGMRQRAERIGAALTITPGPQGGVLVSLALPIMATSSKGQGA